MLSEERVLRSEPIRCAKALALEPRHEASVLGVAERGAQIARVDDPQGLVDGHEPAIERGVMERVETQAVARIEAVRLIG